MDDISLSEQIKSTKESVLQAKSGLLKVFEFVPDDKLNWSPSSTARTPVWIVAHCGASNQVFAMILRGEPGPLPSDPNEVEKAIREGGHDVTTRAEAVKSLDDSTAKILSALDAVTPDMLNTTPDTPAGSLPFTDWMEIPTLHMMGHTSQLEYLQTIWGDTKTH